jgi:hypothetical protein
MNQARENSKRIIKNKKPTKLGNVSGEKQLIKKRRRGNLFMIKREGGDSISKSDFNRKQTKTKRKNPKTKNQQKSTETLNKTHSSPKVKMRTSYQQRSLTK